MEFNDACFFCREQGALATVTTTGPHYPVHLLIAPPAKFQGGIRQGGVTIYFKDHLQWIAFKNSVLEADQKICKEAGHV